ncbi:hypothetical protein [Nostoc sp.]|uniref:hypothetical protein n=1 Tax=Nostoc sp. TaxID=1180 RepID=UPI002FF2AF3A
MTQKALAEEFAIASWTDVYLSGAIANFSFTILKNFVNIEDESLYPSLCDCSHVKT